MRQVGMEYYIWQLPMVTKASFISSEHVTERTKYSPEILTFLLDTLSKPTPQNPAMLAILNAQNKSGNTALHWAALNGHLECVKKLLDYGADPTIANHKGHDAVYEAELNDKREVVEWVLKEGGEGLEEGFGGGPMVGEGSDGVEMDEDEPSYQEDEPKLEGTMDKMDIKEGSLPVKA
jgi:ankyrin repeat protein